MAPSFTNIYYAYYFILSPFILFHGISGLKHFTPFRKGFNSYSDYKIPSPSLEQSAIIEQVKQQQNIIVNAVAGSGKTTLSLLIAKEFPQKLILMLAYNRKLRKETQEKIIVSKCKSTEVHTFHSFGFSYYSTRCSRDPGLQEVVDMDSKAELLDIAKYDIIIMDEAQDITPLFHSFVSKVIKDIASNYDGHKPQLIIIGDELQSIYQ